LAGLLDSQPPELAAWQRGAFGVLAWIIAIGAVVVLAAFYLQPLIFLVAAAMLGLIAIAGMTNSVRAAWRLHMNRARRRIDRRSARGFEGAPRNHRRDGTTPENRKGCGIRPNIYCCGRISSRTPSAAGGIPAPRASRPSASRARFMGWSAPWF